jgi:hypothetical protein
MVKFTYLAVLRKRFTLKILFVTYICTVYSCKNVCRQKIEDMMSAIGGNMGLYIGASFLTIFEVLHLLCGVIWDFSFGMYIHLKYNYYITKFIYFDFDVAIENK